MKTSCDALMEETKAASPNWEKRFEKSLGHIGILAPMRSPFLDAFAIENPLAMQIIGSAMGSEVYINFYNTNNSWPGSGIQRIHRDMEHFYHDYPFPLPVAGVVVNVPLVDFTEENGSTEVWPGSHLITDSDPSDRDKLEERAALLPPARTNMPAGSIVVRDLRMWHRGMPNQTNQVRSMLAVVYIRNFVISHTKLDIPRNIWDALPDRSRRLLRFGSVLEQ